MTSKPCTVCKGQKIVGGGMSPVGAHACTHCSGTGVEPTPNNCDCGHLPQESSKPVCTACGGTGKLHKVHGTNVTDYEVGEPYPCPHCHGTGVEPAPNNCDCGHLPHERYCAQLGYEPDAPVEPAPQLNDRLHHIPAEKFRPLELTQWNKTDANSNSEAESRIAAQPTPEDELTRWLEYALATLHGDEQFRSRFEQVMWEEMPKLRRALTRYISEQLKDARIEGAIEQLEKTKRYYGPPMYGGIDKRIKILRRRLTGGTQ